MRIGAMREGSSVTIIFRFQFFPDGNNAENARATSTGTGIRITVSLSFSSLSLSTRTNLFISRLR